MNSKQINAIFYLELAAAMLDEFAPGAAALAKDLTPIGDGSGTVADHFKAAVLKLESSMDQLYEAAIGQPDAIIASAVAEEAAEDLPVLPTAPSAAKTTSAAIVETAMPVETAKPVKVTGNAPEPFTPGRGPAGILPAPFRKMAGS